MLLERVRSEWMPVERFRYDLSFRRFVARRLSEEAWRVAVFRNERERLLEGDVARQFFAGIVWRARRRGLTSSGHLSVDGTIGGGLGGPEAPPAETGQI